MPYFDVRQFPPYTRDCIATRSINLMCAVLHCIKYEQLYDQPFHDGSENSTLNKIIENINNLHPDLQRGATSNERIVIPMLAGLGGAFVRIRSVLSIPGTPEIRLGELFYRKRVHPTTNVEQVLKNFIVDSLESVHTALNDQMFHFCVPFLTHQLNSAQIRPTEAQFRRFIRVLGDRTMQSFYDCSYTQEEKDEVIAARQLGIFRERRPAASRPPKPIIRTRDGNGRHCVNGVCCGSNDPDDWCNTITVGGSTVCSLGSDTGTQCYPTNQEFHDKKSRPPRIRKGGRSTKAGATKKPSKV